MSELKPLVQEYHRLEEAVGALETVNGSAAPATSATVRRRRGRPSARQARAATTPPEATTVAPSDPRGRRSPRKAGRRKGSGNRAAQALALVSERPGITIPELAARMEIKQNYLYRVMPALEGEGKVLKQGRGWHPKKTA